MDAAQTGTLTQVARVQGQHTRTLAAMTETLGTVAANTADLLSLARQPGGEVAQALRAAEAVLAQLVAEMRALRALPDQIEEATYRAMRRAFDEEAGSGASSPD